MTAIKAIDDYLQSCRWRTFQFGTWDCALFCADIILRVRGSDPGDGLRGKYTTRDGYLSILPVPLEGLPEHFGLTPSGPDHGAIFWTEAKAYSEGALGIVWHGNLIQPGRRGLRSIKADPDRTKFYTI